ncbi:MAG: hypothetical protein MJZ91_03785 [Bacteroidales bacterium]|nr:hypothetical protein [Bacteroidales bacterium]
MKRKLNEKQLEELKFKYEWCKTIQEFINAHEDDSFDVELMQDLDPTFAEQNSSMHDYLIRVLDKAYLEQNLVGLRSSINDYNEDACDLTPSEFEELNAILREKFGEDLVHNRQKDLAKIKRIIKRGKINNEDEFRLLKGRIDELLEEEKVEEAQLLDKLMFEFEESLRPKDK